VGGIHDCGYVGGLAASAVMDGGEFSKLRLGYFSVGEKPTLAAGAAQRLVGRPLDADAIAEAKAALAQDLDPQSDQQASSAARLHLAGVLLERCANDLPSAPDFARSTSR
jgi:carbon-monoxide dehydrogenase medium subunit